MEGLRLRSPFPAGCTVTVCRKSEIYPANKTIFRKKFKIFRKGFGKLEQSKGNEGAGEERPLWPRE